ncbi:hypothetical protein [Mucilaginibacter limnophilus]|uniref:hypothetical protein n=1 Tax=Mucilaginibacter limnophilus TaxID=1932778 RepID=UPI0013E3630B|nr:hypothetical protein [Mucilaginibacter limnophilus]
MDVNYPIVGTVIAAAIMFLILLIRRNMKDEKTFEKDLNKLDKSPEKHDSGEASS